MCLICLELLSKKMSIYDAKLALVELKSTISREHQKEVSDLIETLTPKEGEKDDYDDYTWTWANIGGSGD